LVKQTYVVLEKEYHAFKAGMTNSNFHVGLKTKQKLSKGPKKSKQKSCKFDKPDLSCWLACFQKVVQWTFKNL
jgi:hypothetical protein